MNKKLKLLFISLLFLGLFFQLRVYSRAETEIEIDKRCSVTARLYAPSMKFWELDIRRAVNNALISGVVSIYTNLAGIDPDLTAMCGPYLMDKLPIEGYGSDLKNSATLTSCVLTDEQKDIMEPICDTLVSDLGSNNNSGGGTASLYQNSISSSLIGIGTMVEGAARKEPLPTNLAYYWNQSVEKIPFAGRALAAGGDAYENLPVVKAVYRIWNVSLKVALGLLSVVLLYTGIMITMGRKLSSQLVVSVQYAIPKILIGTILIIFSYPIGAVITSISFGLFRGAFPLVANLIYGQGSGGLTSSGILMLTMLVQVMDMAKGGTAHLLISIIMLIILTITKILLYIKVLMVYIKMAFSIVTAPIEFVVGTIPGNDDKMKDWFMRMLKYGLTLFGMGIIIPFTLFLSIEIMVVYISADASGETGGWGSIISLLTPIIITVFGFGVGMGMEKKIDEFITGKKKR